MPEKIPSALGLALAYLRLARGWTKKRLASVLGMGDRSLLSRYERGDELTRKKADALVAPLALPPEAVDVLLLAHGLIFPPASADASPTALTPKERRRIDRAALAAGWTAVEILRKELRRRKRQEKADAARAEAKELWARLKTVPRQEWRDLITALPEFRSWALAEAISHESERAAAHKADEALRLAELALFIAERTPGEENWSSRLQGYCWAYVANSRRVGNDLVAADEAFACAWHLWRAGAGSDPELLRGWRLLDLEASLRIAQQRFSKALNLLDRALVSSRGDQLATARILLKKEHVFEQTGDIRAALGALTAAAPFVATSGDPRLLFALRFKTVNNLCHLNRYGEAAKLLREVRDLAVEQADELSLTRVVWLTARVAAGQGRPKEAIAGLEQVGRYFTEKELPYDAALAALDLAVLWLEAGRTAEVRELAVGLSWIFKAQKIHREALAALTLFCEAARQETATVALTRQTIDQIEKARRSAPRPATRGAEN